MKRLFTIFIPVTVAFVLLGMVAADVSYFSAERPIAIVRRFKPEVLVKNMEEGKTINLDLNENIGEKLFSGDTLETNSDGYALVLFMDKSVAKVKPSSTLVINGEVGSSSKSMSTRINLQNGEVFLNVEPQGGNDFEVATSRSLASVKGTDFGNSSDGYVWVENGQVDVTALNSGQTISLYNKMFAQVDENGNNINSGTLTDEQLEQLKQKYNELVNDLDKKELKFRFRDQNGQIREITIDVFEEGQN